MKSGYLDRDSGYDLNAYHQGYVHRPPVAGFNPLLCDIYYPLFELSGVPRRNYGTFPELFATTGGNNVAPLASENGLDLIHGPWMMRFERNQDPLSSAVLGDTVVPDFAMVSGGTLGLYFQSQNLNHQGGGCFFAFEGDDGSTISLDFMTLNNSLGEREIQAFFNFSPGGMEDPITIGTDLVTVDQTGWHSIVVTVRPGIEMAMYVDGVLVAEGSGLVDLALTDRRFASIAIYPPQGLGPPNGRYYYDEVVWDFGVWDAAKIAAFNAGGW